MATWYVNGSRAAVNWGTAVTSNTATLDIFQLDAEGLHESTRLWARSGDKVMPEKLAAAQALASSDPVPAQAVSPAAPKAGLTGGGIKDGTVTFADLAPSVPAAVASSSALTATYGRIGRQTSMLTPVVVAGDSISTTAFAGLAFAGALGGWPAGVNTDGATQPWNAGVSGNNSTQLLTRFDTDVIAKAPAVVHILIGTNDAGQSVPVDTFAANVRSMVAKCRAIGARVILGTPPPTSSSTPTDRKARVIALRQWMVRYALQQRVEVADYYRALVDPSTGGYASGFDSGDGVHPTPAGIGVMAAELAASINRTPSASLLLTQDANDPWNFVRNALFLSSFGTGWNNPVLTGLTASLTTSDANIQGNWGKLAAVATASTASVFQNQNTTQGGAAYAVGNWHAIGGRIQSSALSSGEWWNLGLKFVNLATMYLGVAQNKLCATQAGGLALVQEQASLAASTQTQTQFQLSAGTGDVSVAQVTVYDLTAMGVTDAAGNLV